VARNRFAEGATAMIPGSVEDHACDWPLPELPVADVSPWPPFGGEPATPRYYKRYRMEIDLNDLPEAELPAGYCCVPWDPGLLQAHAETLFASFHEGIDTRVFPSLGDRSGCLYLMTEISRKSNFEPGATLLLAHGDDYCGTVQGIRERGCLGSIQNLGVARRWRGQGLGGALLVRALHGFRSAGLGRALLEVTAENDVAVRLYRRLGFRRRKTIYKPVETSAHVPLIASGWLD
jgi:GNAT superfamily N-acetyltransferase